MEVLITNCSDSSYWYNRSLGEAFVLTHEEGDMYWVRDHDGFRNVIMKKDAIPLSDEPLYNSIAAKRKASTSDGSTAEYYKLPKGCTELYHLIIHKNMNGQVAEAFRSLYRYGESSHSDCMRDMRKVIAYAEQEIERLSNED